MSRINDDIAAKKIMEDIEAMNNQAKVSGVSAYLQKPRRVPRPNERFLRNTIANVQHANRRVDEEEMWALYEQRREREAGGATTSGGDHEDQELPERQRDTLKEESFLKRDRDESGALELHGEDQNDDDDLEEFLAGRRKRGRGARGPQADAPGPYLDAAAAGAVEEKEAYEEQVSRSAKRRELGPTRPSWLGDAVKDTPGLNRRGGSESDSSGSDSERRGRKEKEKKRRKTKESKEKRDKRKSDRNDKKDKKKKSKSEKKEKRKKKRRRRRSRSPSTSSSDSR